MFLTNAFSRIYVIAIEDFSDNFHLTKAGVTFTWWLWENNTSNSTLHLNDTLKYTSCFLVYYVFTSTRNQKDAEGETESKVAQIV